MSANLIAANPTGISTGAGGGLFSRGRSACNVFELGELYGSGVVCLGRVGCVGGGDTAGATASASDPAPFGPVTLTALVEAYAHLHIHFCVAFLSSFLCCVLV